MTKQCLDCLRVRTLLQRLHSMLSARDVVVFKDELGHLENEIGGRNGSAHEPNTTGGNDIELSDLIRKSWDYTNANPAGLARDLIADWRRWAEWRLNHAPPKREDEPRGECICPKCGLRHGSSNLDGGILK